MSFFKKLLPPFIHRFQIEIHNIRKELERIERKLSMPNNIWQNKNVRFYVPYYPIDLIQSIIVDDKKFYEEDILESLNRYIPYRGGIILDIGANIGNHSLYWATQRNAERVYAFEPVYDTFQILKKNVEINNLHERITIFNYGLSDEDTRGDFETYFFENTGATKLKKSENGNIYLKILDNIDLKTDKIDFIKIDVEDHEIQVLKGSKKTLEKFKPVIFIESSPVFINQVSDILKSYNYHLTEKFPYHNYIFEPKEAIIS